jgi:hypothetical protein
MGNTISLDKNVIQCYLCKQDIQLEQLVKCLRCKIYVHNGCETKHRNNQQFCVCPNCNKIGTLGIKY